MEESGNPGGDAGSNAPKPTGTQRCFSSLYLTCRQFVLLLAKNFLLQVRRPIGSVVELLIPPLAVVILVLLRLIIPAAERQCFLTFPSQPLDIPFSDNYTLYYAPNNNTQANAVMQIVGRLLEDTGGVVMGVATEDDFVDAIQAEEGVALSGCFINGSAIYFDLINDTTIEYSIRLRHDVGNFNSWLTAFTSLLNQGVGARVQPNPYLSEGFLQLENVMDRAIIEQRTGSPVEMDVEIRQFPYPGYLEDPFLNVAMTILPLFMILSLLYSAGYFVKELVLEKESRIRETMKMMGLSQWILWTTWYAKQLLFLLVPVIVMSIILKYGNVFPQSDGFLLFIFLVLFIISGISFCFFISVWFSSSRIGLIAGFMLWFLAYIPYLFANSFYDDLPLGGKLGFCVLPNTCIGLGVTVLSALEIRQEGLTFNNYASPISADDTLSMGWITLMLLLDTVVYMLLSWYIDAVKPGQYGVPRPFYFPFLPSYWTGKSRGTKYDRLEEAPHVPVDASAHEEPPRNLAVGISVEGISKIFNRRNPLKRKIAVNHLSLNMYKDQITVLLGHNGAGKTTTMSMITGLLPPTSGTAFINGFDIRTDIELVRRSLGICPQHNVLFDRLTVSEHLKFFALLKGVPYDKVKIDAEKIVVDLNLEDKRDVKSSNLSGGMKRKLSVGIALVGGSEIVILDEPTSGMDPYARRATWDLLVQYKKGRTMLLTTHFMDEADLLGDRIAIMAEGALRCSGSSLFLKSRYGVGYHMTMVKEPQCDSKAVIALVTKTVEGATAATDVGAELTFRLPSQSTHQFPQLFDILDATKTELGISSFGVSVTTMEEVFIRVGTGDDEALKSRLDRQMSLIGDPAAATANMALEEADRTVQEKGDEKAPPAGVMFEAGKADLGSSDASEPTVSVVPQARGIKHYNVNTGFALWVQQFWAIILKRFYNSLRNWSAVVWQLVLPLIFILLALILAVTVPSTNTDDPKRVLTLDNSAVSSNVTVFWAQFGNGTSPVDLSRANPIGSTDYFDYTAPVEAIRGNVEDFGDVSDCCTYRNQFLDKFCARQLVSDFSDAGNCTDNEDFGYKNCLDCLGCCQATAYQLATCSIPRYQNGIGNTEDFCPAPPVVTVGSEEMGALDSFNVYVAEHLLNVSEEVELAIFFQQFVAGFVVHSPDPPYSVCGYANKDDTCMDLIPALASFEIGEDTLNAAMGSTLGACTLEASTIMNSNCDQLWPGNWSSEYNALFDGCIASLACGLPGLPPSTDERLVGLQSSNPPESSEAMATVWYNNQPFHMIAATLNAFYNVYLNQQLSSENGFTITVNNHPLPRNLNTQVESSSSSALAFVISTISAFGISFLFSSFIIFLVQETESKAKHLQFVSGVQVTSYWLGTFVWDLVNCLAPTILGFILFAAFQVDGYKDENLVAVLLLLIMGCWASIPITYCFSFAFSNPLVAYGFTLMFFYIGSVVLQAITLILVIYEPEIADHLHYFFLLHPLYGFSIGLSDMYSNQLVQNDCTRNEMTELACEAMGVEYTDSAFSFLRPAIGHIFLYLFLEGIFFLILAMVIEYVRKFSSSIVQRLRCQGPDQATTGTTNEVEAGIGGEDSDVAQERVKVNSLETVTEKDAVVLRGLVKEYKDIFGQLFGLLHVDQCAGGGKLAVRGINLIIPKGECFGLLGVNGAGKTTTFKMLTGDILASSGTAFVAGHNIQTQLRLVQQHVGYCPQFDALIDRLTGREVLTMFSRLRGIPEKEVPNAVQTEIERLDLKKHANKQCGNYSGGNRRKLSTAVAMVGNPPILLLDEPTTGMDPATRRFLWDAITNVVRDGRSVILTSHSMEECEALCTRLAIMVNGRFKCLGAIQHLKNKFGSGYTIQVKVLHTRRPPEYDEIERQSSRTSIRRRVASFTGGVSPGASGMQFDPYSTIEVQTFIVETFPGSKLLEQHQGSVTYQIPSEGVNWSTIFKTMEANKKRLYIVDYSVTQATLEQVFINFASQQNLEA